MNPLIPKIIELYHSTNLSYSKIAKIVGCSNATVGNILRARNLASKTKGHKIEMVGNDHAKCWVCHTVKPIISFATIKIGVPRPYKQSRCNSCAVGPRKIKANNDINLFLKYSYNSFKQNNHRQCIFQLTFEEYQTIYFSQNGKCFYTDNDMSCTLLKNGWKSRDNSLSIDKIIPELGYIKGNCVMCLFKANRVKTNLTLTEIESWLPDWYNRIYDKFLNEGNLKWLLL